MALLLLMIAGAGRLDHVTNLTFESLSVDEPAALAVSPSETFCALGFDESLTFFTLEKGVVAVAGKKGEGPGEHQAAIGVHWAPEPGCFAVHDILGHKLTLWSETGALKGEIIRLPRLRQLALVADDLLLYGEHALGIDGPPMLILDDRAKGMKRVLWQLQNPISAGQVTKGRAVPWDPALRFAAGKGLIAVSFPIDDKVILLSHNGQITGTIETELARLPVGEEQKQGFIQTIRPDARKLFKTKMGASQYWPNIAHLAIDHEGRIWVYGFPREVDAPYPIVVFDSQGNRCLETEHLLLLTNAIGERAFFDYDGQEGSRLQIWKIQCDQR